LAAGAWIERHPRFVRHFVSTRSIWLNLIERQKRDRPAIKPALHLMPEWG
jgi:hypothetical protein